MDTRPSFWTTIPGILSGIAMIITAAGTIYLGLNASGHETKSRDPDTSGRYSEWPSVATETFSQAPSRWDEGARQYPDGSIELSLESGKYRWSINNTRPLEHWVASPAGSVVDFYAAVDARVVESTARDFTVSLQFGWTGNTAYSYSIAKSPRETSFLLIRIGHAGLDTLIAPTRIGLEDVNRLGVAVNDATIRLFLNDTLLSEYKDPAYTGGRVVLAVGTGSSGSIVVDFDDFELRRKPDAGPSTGRAEEHSSSPRGS